MNDPEDLDENLNHKVENEDGMTDSDMYDIYGPDEDGDYDNNDY